MVNRNRRTRLSSSTPKPQKSQEPKDWRDNSSGSGRRKTRGRRSPVAKWLLLCLTLVVLAALTAFFVEIIIRRHYTVPMLVLAVLDYDAPLPPNAWADEDADRLNQAWAGTTQLGVRDQAIHVTREPKSSWTGGERFLEDVARELGTLTPGGPGKNVVLLYVSAHGVLDDADEPVLLLGRFEQDSDTALPVGALPPRVRVLDLLRKLDQARPDQAKLVLFLDAGKIGSNWQLGILHNRFAERLPEAVQEAKAKDLVVINSTGIGQVGACFLDQGGSAFALAVCAALKGQADTSPKDGKVTLHELRDYLQGEVSSQVRNKNVALQEPLFLNADEDFPLAFAENVTQPQPSRAAVVSADARRQLDSLWQIHHQLAPWRSTPDETPDDRSLQRRDRFRFEAFGQGLLRLEELYQAGGHYSREITTLLPKLQNLAQQLAQRPEAPNDPTAPSLPLALQMPTERQDAVWNVVRKHWPESVADAEPLGDVTPDELASIVLDRLLDDADGIRHGLIDRALNLVQSRIESGSARSLLELVEMRTLRSFRRTGHLPDADSDQAGILQEVVRTRRDAESAASATREILALDTSRVLVDRGDQHRRQAEDQLFVGGYGQAAELLDKANQRYQQAGEVESALHHVLATRDRIWMEVPYLVQWAAGIKDDRGIQTHHQNNVQTCIDLLQGAVVLDRGLYERIGQWRVEGHSWTENALDELVRQISGELLVESRGLRERLTELHRALADDILHATVRVEGVPSFAQIRNLLRTPLVTGAVRQQLQASCGDAYLAGSSADATFWREHPEFSHPASLLVERSPKLRNDSPAAVRQHLRQLVQRLARQDTAQRAAPDDNGPWLVRCQTARDAAAASSLFALAGVEQPDAPLRDPLGRLEKYYQAEFWLWQAQRFSDDFYGDEGLPKGEHPPYFARVAQSCLDRAERYHQLPGIQVARSLLEKRIAAARDWDSGRWIRIATADGSSSDKVPLQHHAENRGEIQPTLDWQLPEHLPMGLAALFLEDPDRQRARLRPRSAAALPEELPRVLAFPVRNTQASAESPTLPLISPILGADALPGRSHWTFGLFYRGHLGRRSFTVEVPQVGQLVQVKRRPPGKPRVQVVWDRQPVSVAFCLDCSLSMSERKMENAKRILRELLRDLEAYEDRPDFSVSLWLFGHRRYWSGNDEPYNMTWNHHWQTHTGQSDNPEVTFENDVQLIWRRNADWLRHVHLPPLKDVVRTPSWSDWLRRENPIIIPFGYTPLHLVMERAISEHLGEAGPQSIRRLIVLSDGMHQVNRPPDGQRSPIFNPPWQYDANKDRTAEDVGRMLSIKNRNAIQPIQVLVIGDVDDEGEKELLGETIEGIKKLAGEDACDFMPADFSDEAVQVQVRRSLSLYVGAVYSESSTPLQNPVPLRRNTVFALAPPPRSTRHTLRLDYGDGVAVATAALAVEGDEVFRLDVKEDGDARARLVHQPYRRGGEVDEKRASAVVNGRSGAPRDADYNPKAFFVAAHPPESPLDSTARRFPVSIQNADQGRFSPRPVEVWAEITPVRRQDGTTEPVGRPFVFYDPVWEAAQPVPVLLLGADPWPPEADAADVHVWFKLEDSPFVEQPLSNIRGDREADFRWQMDEHQVEFAVTYSSFQEGNRRGWNVVVLEHQLSGLDDTPGRPGPGTRFQVQLSEPAAEVQREFYPELGRVRHVFRYPNVDETSVGAYRLRVTPVDAIRKDAAEFKIPQPLPVPR